MEQILERRLNKTLKTREWDFKFDIRTPGIYAIEITVSAKSWWQNFLSLRSFFKDDDLTLKIDGISFPKKSGKKGLFDSEVAFNGNNLKGLKKTDLFLVRLNQGRHVLTFLADQKPKLHWIRIYSIGEEEISYLPKDNYPIEDGNRRQWLTIVLVNLGLKNLKIQASAKQGKKFLLFKRDDSDLKLIINSQIQKNKEAKSHKYWYWCGRTLKSKEKVFDKELNLSPGLHYIELWTDRSPEIKEMKLGIQRGAFGKVAFYSDITTSKAVNLRKEPKIKKENIIGTLKSGELLEILGERVIGEWVPSKSYVWHKVKYKNQEGYILSSFVEILGQEREVIIEKIKEKAKELKIDPSLVLALAGCESKYKPYAVSRPFEEKDKEGDPIGAKGIFQLTKPAIKQLHQNKGVYHFSVKDPFDINQNIEGGIRYLKWLYDSYYKGKRQAIEKLIAAYNAGQGYIPASGPLDYSKIPSKKKREQAKQLVKCVIESQKRKNWQYIVYPAILLFLLISAFNFLNKNDFLEPIVSEREYLLSQASDFPAVVWEKEKSQIVFFSSQKQIPGKLSTKRLHLEKIFQIPPETKEWNLIHVYPKALEHPKNVFYFLASTSWSCGQNCSWALFRADLNQNKIDLIDKDIFGLGINLYPSPNFKKIAIASYIYGGFCNSGAELKIVDLGSYTKEKVEGFEEEEYTAQSIESLTWENNGLFEFRVSYSCNKLDKEDTEEIFDYDLKSKKLRLIGQRYYDSSGG